MAASKRVDKFGIASIAPRSGAIVGVAHPIVVTFGAPVADRAAAERALGITSSPAMTGRFDWMGSDTVQWSPTDLAGSQHSGAVCRWSA